MEHDLPREFRDYTEGLLSDTDFNEYLQILTVIQKLQYYITFCIQTIKPNLYY